MEQKNIIIWVMRIFWIFIIGSVFGFFAEMIYALVYTRSLEIRQGLLYGPFIQIYGIGAIAYYVLVTKIQEPKRLFFAGMVMGGVLEYLCSFFQEIFFGTISWDYSDLFINFNGRTSILYCFYWGIIGVFFLKVVYPSLLNIDIWAQDKKFRIISYIFIVLMAINITLSCMVANRQEERRNQISPKNKIDIFLDKIYPDTYMDKVYNNKMEKDIKK